MAAPATNKPTEIRCEEKSRGGMCYEVILAKPCGDKPDPPQAPVSPRPKSCTAEEIQHKLQQAEERRKTMEASRVKMTDRMTKLEEAARKRDEINAAFITQTQKDLEVKLDQSQNNREAYLNGLKAKVHDHLSNVAAVRKQTESEQENLRLSIETKMSSAEEKRDENMRTMLSKLKEHDDHLRSVRLGHEEAIKTLEGKIQSKLNIAEAKRETEIMKKLETLREHSNKVTSVQEKLTKKEEELKAHREQEMAAYEERVRKISQEKEAKRLEHPKITEKVEEVQEKVKKGQEEFKKTVADKLEQRMETADKIKAENAEKAKKQKEENDRRAELVRANKERLMAAEKHETASSG